ncbi:MAG: V-type ATPase subunit [Spirochaetales bacterium]|nr:V-type ATPase subunit [Spirochaetales bacterium]
MATKLATYGYINAKLRTRLSKMLEDPELLTLLRAETTSEVLKLLEDTEYHAAAAAFADTGDLRLAEAMLFETEVNFFNDIGEQVKGEPGDFISALVSRYEVETLKRAIRLWFERRIKGRDIGNEMDYLYRGFTGLRVEELIEAGSLEEIAGLLPQSSYGAVIAESAGTDISQLGLFPVETSIDRYFFSRLLESLNDLSTSDRKIARKLIGVEIDLENLERIVRFKDLYGFSHEKLVDYIIPSGVALRSRDISGDSSEIIKSYVAGHYAGLAPLVESLGREKYSSLVLLEAVLNEVLSLEVKRALLGYPFTLGIVLSYFFLKRREVRRIVLILNAKAYGLDEERVRSLL